TTHARDRSVCVPRGRRRTRRLEDVERLRGGGLEFVEHGTLGIVRLDRLRDPLDRPIRQPGGLAAAKVGADAAAAGNAPTSGTAATLTAASATAVVAV